MGARYLSRWNPLNTLIPSDRLSLALWIEGNVRLSHGTTAVPGPMRLWPYQRAIADSIGDAAIERVTLVKPVRVGFKALLTAAVVQSGQTPHFAHQHAPVSQPPLRDATPATPS